MTIETTTLNMVKRDLARIGHGGKSIVAKKWAGLLKISVQTLYRHLEIGRQRKGERQIEGIEERARLIAQLKCAPPDHRGRITTAQAVKNALANGILGPEYADVSIGTWDRVIRETINLDERRKVVRFQADYPNQMHHVDGSTSSCFYVHRQEGNEYIYRIHKGLKDYKNKPVPIRLRPWLYGMTDDHSGVHCFRYVAALGENSADNVEFLDWTWRNRTDKPFFGLPGKIKGDHGPMMSEEAANAWFALCGVGIDPSEALNKEAHGKIERPWRSLWQSFELPFFMESEWKKFEIAETELNRRALLYQAEYNAKPHRWERKYSRLQVWERINLRGGAVALPENALGAFAKRIERTVTQEGIVWLDNVPYEVKGLHDAKVWVFQGIFDDRMSVVDQKTGLKYEIEGEYRPNSLGEFTTPKETRGQKLRNEALPGGIKNLLYTEPEPAQAAQGPRKVIKIATRVKEVRQIESPLNLDSYHTIDEAWAAFCQTCGDYYLDEPDFRASVRAIIQENGLSRRFVAELAGEIQAEQMQVAL
jgi:signal peptidase I